MTAGESGSRLANVSGVLAPDRLTPRHDLSSFRKGRHESLDKWLCDRALASEELSARTYVVCDANMPFRVVGYSAISTAMEQRVTLPNAKPRRCLAAAEIAGARAIVTHAIDDNAAVFYRRHGFLPAPIGERAMLLPIKSARAEIGD